MRKVALSLSMLLIAAPLSAQESGYKNLQVLPKDTPRRELGQIMLDNLSGLGLPRLAGEGCLYCHVGDLETPRADWNYASDAKPMKQKARVMMAMVREINDKHLAQLEGRLDSDFEVTCASCHSGRTDPRPLPELLWATYQEGGIEAAASKYAELYQRYEGGDAYDFRSNVLPSIAVQLADSGSIDDAIRLAELNVERHPDSVSAKQSWVALSLEKIIDGDGVAKALSELTKLEAQLPAEGRGADLLDALAWRLNRSERQEAGHALIEANYGKYPDQYRALESMAFILSNTERHAEGVEILERWLEANPDHARARRLLVNMTAEPK